MSKPINKVFHGLFVIAILISCNKEQASPSTNQNPEIVLLAFTQGPSTSTVNSDDWIFITDEQGNDLGIISFESGQSYALKSSKISAKEKINVTFFQYIKTSSNETTSLVSFMNITPGQTWVYKKGVTTSDQFPGKASVTLTNFQEESTLTTDVTDNESPLVTGGLYTNFNNNSTYTISCRLPKISDNEIFVSSFRGATPVYFAVKIGNNQNIVKDFSQLQALDHTIQFSSVGDTTTGYVRGVKNVTGINPENLAGSLLSKKLRANTSITLGYNDGFDFYKTFGQIATGKIRRTYEKLGSPPSSIRFIDATLSVNNSSLDNFLFTVSSKYNVRASLWSGKDNTKSKSITWKIFAPQDTKQIINIHPDLLKNYPSYSSSSLVHFSSGFTQFLDDFTYADFIGNTMNVSNSKRFSKESQSIIFYQ